MRLGIVGGGPSCLFVLKKLIESGAEGLTVSIFEKSDRLGAGMPYSKAGSNMEHITNVSGNEIPEMVTTIAEWLPTLSAGKLKRYHLDPENFNDYKVLPRLLFGDYLEAQFKLMLKKARAAGISVEVHLKRWVTDIVDLPDSSKVQIMVGDKAHSFTDVIICSGHYWPQKYEGLVTGYFDSPYPPKKLKVKLNHPVAIKGASLTAIDAIRTLARSNGKFITCNQQTNYQLGAGSTGFKMLLHSRSGLLPAVRFHLEDTHLGKDTILTTAQIEQNRKENGGFLSLDFVFEKNFKEGFKTKHANFYNSIKNMNIEQFVNFMMSFRINTDPFDLLFAEYKEAEESIEKKQSVYWKEMLAVLSFAMNYPAKYFSAEDMQRLQKTLMPLIAIVIAFVPQSSVEEMLALHNAGVLEIIAVGEDSYVEPGKQQGAVYHYTDANGQQQAVAYKTFVDCVGQPHLLYNDVPYKSLLTHQTVSPAMLAYHNDAQGSDDLASDSSKTIKSGGHYYLQVPGIAVNDSFQVMNRFGAYNPHIFMMAVPYIGGFNPDYSGLDFCDEASTRVVKALLKN